MYIDPHKYDSIINRPYQKSKNHPWMSLHDRAAQFAPFAALSGHQDQMNETARRVDSKIELDEDALKVLNDKIQLILSHHLSDVTVTYFIKDEFKQGGQYLTSLIKEIHYNEITKELKLDQLVISIDDILEIDHQLFTSMYLDK